MSELDKWIKRNWKLCFVMLVAIVSRSVLLADPSGTVSDKDRDPEPGRRARGGKGGALPGRDSSYPFVSGKI